MIRQRREKGNRNHGRGKNLVEQQNVINHYLIISLALIYSCQTILLRLRWDLFDYSILWFYAKWDYHNNITALPNRQYLSKSISWFSYESSVMVKKSMAWYIVWSPGIQIDTYFHTNKLLSTFKILFLRFAVHLFLEY